MSLHVKRNKDFLRVLAKCKQHQCKAILKVADESLIKAIVECIYNILRGTVPITTRQKSKLAPFAKPLFKLIEKRVSTPRKKRILIQHGGNFLSVLLSPILTDLESIL